MEKEIIENNKLIADFMNSEAMFLNTAINPYGAYHRMKSGHQGYEPLKYHKEWNWLMPVVEKIETMDYGIKMCRKVVEIYIDSTKENIIKTKESCRIDSLYEAIIEFIKYYNDKETNITK